jgi:hypothetical protein
MVMVNARFAALAFLVLPVGACAPQAPSQDNEKLSGEYLCQYTESQFGYLLDFDTPDLVYWGGTAPVSAVEFKIGKVERVKTGYPQEVGSLVVHKTAVNGAQPSDEKYTISRFSSSELRLLISPDSFDPDFDGSDPVPRCKIYSEGM